MDFKDSPDEDGEGALESKDAFLEWGIETYKSLLSERIILINGEIRESIIERATIPLLRLSQNKKKLPIEIWINSFGGSMEDAQSVVDIIRSSPCRITTKVFGKAMSAAFDIFLAGDRRLVYPNSMLMCHSGGTAMSYRPLPHLDVEANLHQEMYKRWAKYYASRSTVSFQDWYNIIVSAKDRYFFAEEAITKGLAHEIIQYRKK